MVGPPSEFTDETATRDFSVAVELFLASALLLFFELTVIRWLPATVRTLAYFSNVVLVSCFLGMGLGCIYAGRRNLLVTFAPLTLSLVVLAQYLGGLGVANPFQSVEFLFGAGGKNAWVVVAPVLFLVNALAFIGLGQRMAVLLERFRPLIGYSINVGGSLAGSLLFTGLSFMRLPPTFWFGTSLLLAVWLLRRQRTAMIATLCLGVLALVAVHQGEKRYLWSPYYKIALDPLPSNAGPGLLVTVNDDSHQTILDLRPEELAHSPQLTGWEKTYGLPYRIGALKAPCKVLVLGAGAGNDVAAALRDTPCRVDAVELDPTIAGFGRTLHPEHPYLDPRTKVHVTDARAFLAQAHGPYDRIVLGWLDSHRVFSTLSNVRQDNFVYTVQSMRAACRLLTEDGLLSLSFYVGKEWVGEKLYAMLREAFSHDPEVFALQYGGYGPNGQIFLVGRRPWTTAPAVPEGFVDRTSEYRGRSLAPVPTDRWPYLYYRAPVVSWEYMESIATMLVISFLLVLSVRRSGRLPAAEATEFALLGAGFLLLEVRNVTTLALTFGSTWVVSSVVIVAVLLMILVANAAVAGGLVRRQSPVLWLFLIGSILVGSLASGFADGIESFATRAVVMTLVATVTFALAGLNFAAAFAPTAAPASALGFNILGAVCGGLSEYAAILVGLDGLLYIVVALYLGAWLASLGVRRVA
jgi:hypothetical protein